MRAGRSLYLLAVAAVLTLTDALVSGQNLAKYEYDSAGRLKSTTYLDGKQTVYGLDAAGNRLSISTGTNTTPPGVPTGLTGVASSSTLVSLSWNGSTDVGFLAGYRIFRNNTFLGSVVGTPPANPPTSYSDSTTTCNVTYTYTVEAYDTVNPPNVSGPSAAFSIMPPTTIPPSVPTGVTKGTVSATQVVLTWSASTDSCGSTVAGYDIFRNGIQIGTSSGTTYTDSSAGAGNSVTYTLAAFDSVTPTANTSAQSAGLVVITPPNAPTSPTATAIEPNFVTITWTGVSGTALSGYRIYRNNSLLTSVAAGVTNYTDTSTSGSTNYTYSVSAYDSGGESAQTAAPSITTPFLFQITSATGAVLAPVAAYYTSTGPVPAICGSAGGIGGNGPCEFFVNEAYGSKSAVRTSVNSISPSSCPYIDTLAPGYTAGSGGTGASNGCLATYVIPTAFGQAVDSSTPTGLTATATSATSISLSWTASTDVGGPGLGGYFIYRNGGLVPTTTGTGTTYVDSTAACNQTYSYTVASFDTASPPNISGQSSAASATTPIKLPPSVPTGASASVSPTQVVLTWSPSSDPCNVPVAGYQIYRNSTFIGNTTTNSFTDSNNIVGASTYFYTAASFDGQSPPNVSVQSPAFVVTTPPQPFQITDSSGNVISAASSLYKSVIVPAICGGGNGPCQYLVFQKYGGQLQVRADTANSTSGPWTNTMLAQGYSIGSGGNNMVTYGSASTYGTDIAPPTPTGLTGSAASPTVVNLSWNAVTDSNGVLAGYRIYRNATQIGTSATPNYTDSTAAANTTYTYTVAAYDTLNVVGAQSAGVSVTTPSSIIQITSSAGTSLSSLYSVKILPAVCGGGSGNGPCNFIVTEISNSKVVRLDTAPSTSGPWTNNTLLSGYTIGTGSNALVTFATAAVYGN